MNAEIRHAASDALKQIADTLRYGCTDHYCKWAPEKPKGMGTNGGCRCPSIPETLLDIARMLEEAAVRQKRWEQDENAKIKWLHQ